MPYQMGLSCKWINDNQRFLSKFSDTIRNSPSLIYQLEVVHSPSSLLAGLPLDQSSPEFSNQLNKVLYGQEYEKCVQNFQMDDPVWFVDYLDKVCPHVNFLARYSSQDRLSIVLTLPVPLPENVYGNSGAYAEHTQYFQHPT